MDFARAICAQGKSGGDIRGNHGKSEGKSGTDRLSVQIRKPVVCAQLLRRFCLPRPVLQETRPDPLFLSTRSGIPHAYRLKERLRSPSILPSATYRRRETNRRSTRIGIRRNGVPGTGASDTVDWATPRLKTANEISREDWERTVTVVVKLY